MTKKNNTNTTTTTDIAVATQANHPAPVPTIGQIREAVLTVVLNKLDASCAEYTKARDATREKIKDIKAKIVKILRLPYSASDFHLHINDSHDWDALCDWNNDLITDLTGYHPRGYGTRRNLEAAKTQTIGDLIPHPPTQEAIDASIKQVNLSKFHADIVTTHTKMTIGYRWDDTLSATEIAAAINVVFRIPPASTKKLVTLLKQYADLLVEERMLSALIPTFLIDMGGPHRLKALKKLIELRTGNTSAERKRLMHQARVSALVANAEFNSELDTVLLAPSKSTKCIAQKEA